MGVLFDPDFYLQCDGFKHMSRKDLSYALEFLKMIVESLMEGPNEEVIKFTDDVRNITRDLIDEELKTYIG
jgi:hypothetical protein